MARKSRREAKVAQRKEWQSNRWLWGTAPVLVLLLIGGGWLLSRSQTQDIVAEIRGEIILAEGAQTSYGIPLSLDNTQQFIDYSNAATLTPRQEKTTRDALLPLRAPC